MARRKKPQSEYMRRKLQRKAPPKPRRASRRKAKQEAEAAALRILIRTAAKAGATEAIEHCANFWSISDGYRKYIDQQVELQAEALMAAVRKVVTQLIVSQNLRRKQRP